MIENKTNPPDWDNEDDLLCCEGCGLDFTPEDLDEFGLCGECSDEEE